MPKEDIKSLEMINFASRENSHNYAYRGKNILKYDNNKCSNIKICFMLGKKLKIF